VNKLGGDCQLLDSNGNNAFHYLAANKVESSALEQHIREQSGETATQQPPELFKKLVEDKVAEQETLRSRMAVLLLNGKCNPNAANNEAETPLMHAVENGNVSFARFMLTSRLVQARLTAKPNSRGKTLLATMADKCFDMDPCAVVFFTGQSDDYTLFDKWRGEFERMACVKDQSELTPFQVASQKARAFLTSPNTKSNSEIKLPEHVVRFMIFLYKDCRCDPNELIFRAQASSAAPPPTKPGRFQEVAAVSDDNDDDDDNSNDSKSVSDETSAVTAPVVSGPNAVTPMEVDSESAVAIPVIKPVNSTKYTSPLANLISDKSVDLLEKLVTTQQSSSSSNGRPLVKLNLNVYDSDGLTPLLKSVVLGETKFAVKLLELDYQTSQQDFVANVSSQVCQKRGGGGGSNSSGHLEENLIQLAVRHKCQLTLINRFIDLVVTAIHSSSSTATIVKLFAKMLQHENAYKQNFLHTLAGLKASFASDTAAAGLPSCMALSELISRIARVLAMDSSSYSGLLLQLASAQDKLGRTPLHVCLASSGRASNNNNSNIDLEIFFIEKIYNLISAR
jgi:ankyrin repeat protein